MAGHWTEERDQEMLRLRRQKYSAAGIAAMLGDGLTRNAVIGRLHRLGIKEGKVVKKRELKKKKAEVKRFTQQRRPTPAFDELAREVKQVVVSAPRKKRVVIECTDADRGLAASPRNVLLMDLEPLDCRWPVNDPEPKGEHLFCGHPKRYGSYCAAHAALSVGQGTFAEAMADRLGWAA